MYLYDLRQTPNFYEIDPRSWLYFHLQIDTSEKVHCPFYNCDQLVSISDLVEHCNDKDLKEMPCLFDPILSSGIKSVEILEETFTKDWVLEPSLITISKMENFYVECGRMDGVWSFWIYHVGPASQTEKFKCKIRYFFDGNSLAIYSFNKILKRWALSIWLEIYIF